MMKRFSPFITAACVVLLLLISCSTAPERAMDDEASKHGMVAVPNGWFMMGSEAGEVNERFPHEVYLNEFYIDMYEVSSKDFAVFLNIFGNPDTKYFSENETSTIMTVFFGKSDGTGSTKYMVREGYESYPANNVSWYGADAYCRWMGKRLPTEAEWEKTARGTDERTYPWGYDAPDEHRARYNQQWEAEGLQVMVPVNSLPSSASFYGAEGMAGNVWEWTNDWYRQNYCDYCDPTGSDYEKLASEIIGEEGAQKTNKNPDAPPRRNPRGPSIGAFKVIRGGAWDDRQGETIRSAYRQWLAPEDRSGVTGFRCASTGIPERIEWELPVLEPVAAVEEAPKVVIPVIPSFDPVFFDFDRYDIKNEEEPALQAVYDWMKEYDSVRMTLEGHCDDRGSKKYNMTLGLKRARTVKAYLIRMGIEPDRLTVVSRGKDKPFCFIRSIDCWRSNRRVNFIPELPPGG